MIRRKANVLGFGLLRGSFQRSNMSLIDQITGKEVKFQVHKVKRSLFNMFKRNYRVLGDLTF